MQSHTVTCHLQSGQNDWSLLYTTAVTHGWNRYPNKSQHRNLTLEKKFSHRSCWDLNQRPFNHRSILLPYPHLSSKNDATYAVWISSNFLWLAHSVNVFAFPSCGPLYSLWHMHPWGFAHRLTPPRVTPCRSCTQECLICGCFHFWARFQSCTLYPEGPCTEITVYIHLCLGYLYAIVVYHMHFQSQY